MNKIFCVSCGYKIEYNYDKPSFCPKCGEPVDGVSSRASSVEVVDEQNEITESYDLSKIKRGISVDGYQNQNIKIEDVIGSGSEQDDLLKRKPSNLPDGQDMIKLNESDCAKVIRSKDIDER